MRKYAVLALAAGLALALPMAANAQQTSGQPQDEIQTYNPSAWDPGAQGTVAGSRSGRAGDQIIVTGPNDFTKANSVRAVKVNPMVANGALLNTQAEHERRQYAQSRVGAHPRVVQALESAGIGLNSITDVAVENGLATIYYSN